MAQDTQYTSANKPNSVGIVIITISNTNPADLLGYGTWSSVGTLKVVNTTIYVWERTA